nr:hypothetical protein [Tanacetum cinerariifolium]
MERSMHYGIGVRVIQGFKYEGSASGMVYVYDMLYMIVEEWFDVGNSGFGVFKFKLVRMKNQVEMVSVVLKFANTLRTRPLEAWPVEVKSDGCSYVFGCTLDCLCAKKNGGEFAYDVNDLLMRGKPLIFECGPYCRCPPDCQNRVSQKGSVSGTVYVYDGLYKIVEARFDVGKSGFSVFKFKLVRMENQVEMGSVVLKFANTLRTRHLEARLVGDQAKLFTMNEDALVYPNRIEERWAEWGDLSQIFTDYVRPLYPSIPPLDYVQLVLYEHSHYAFPHLMLFAMENIPPLRELILDYGAAPPEEASSKLAISN